MATSQKKRQERNMLDDALNSAFGGKCVLELADLQAVFKKAGQCATQDRLEWYLNHHKRLLSQDCKQFLTSKFGSSMDKKYFRVEKPQRSARQRPAQSPAYA